MYRKVIEYNLLVVSKISNMPAVGSKFSEDIMADSAIISSEIQ